MDVRRGTLVSEAPLLSRKREEGENHGQFLLTA